jgi:riboflavin-specific deaminase-like protein
VSAARDEPAVVLRALLPEAGSLTADEAVDALRFWEMGGPERPYVAVNMVATVDGRATVAGRTAPISSVADRQLFHALRTRVDAVMIGAGTLRLERYGRLVRDPRRREQRVAAGLAADPIAVVVSGRLDLPADIPLLQDPDSHVVIVTAADASLAGCAARVEYLRTSDLAAALAQLRRELGVRSVLCEGGPSLNGSLLTAGLIDELFLTTVPLIAGAAGALTIVAGGGTGEPAAAGLAWLLEHEGALFARYRLQPALAST